MMLHKPSEKRVTTLASDAILGYRHHYAVDLMRPSHENRASHSYFQSSILAKHRPWARDAMRADLVISLVSREPGGRGVVPERQYKYRCLFRWSLVQFQQLREALFDMYAGSRSVTKIQLRLLRICEVCHCGHIHRWPVQMASCGLRTLQASSCWASGLQVLVRAANGGFERLGLFGYHSPVISYIEGGVKPKTRKHCAPSVSSLLLSWALVSMSREILGFRGSAGFGMGGLMCFAEASREVHIAVEIKGCFWTLEAHD